MRGIFLDANAEMNAIFDRVVTPEDPPVHVNLQDDVSAAELPGLLAGYDFLLDDHSALPLDAMALCPDLKNVIFLGTGARSYMDVDALEAAGVRVHIIRGYGDTAVAEHTIAMMWAAARALGEMHRAVKAGGWPRTEGMQLTGKTIGLIGLGGIGAEVARIAGGGGMKVLAWNRTPRPTPGVTFVDLDTLLAESHVVSLHLLLNDETRGFLSAERLARMRPGVIFVNTARAGLVDEAAMMEAIASGRIGHAALDVFHEEPLPPGHPITALENVTLSAHSAFRTPEASEALVRRGLDIARRLRDEALSKAG